MTGWSDPQKGGRAVGAALYPTLSSLLSTAPQPGIRATALDAPGSDLYASGGKWAGDPGRFANESDANYVAYLAAIAAGSVYPAPSILIGPTPATAVAMTWQGATIGYAVGVVGAPSPTILARPVHVATFGDSTGFITPSNYTADYKSCQNMALSIPASGSTPVSIPSTKMIGITNKFPIRYVGDFGISGQNTNEALARGAAVFSGTRKAPVDILLTTADVVFMRMGSVNDVVPLGVGDTQAKINAIARRHISIVKKILSLGLRVVDTGILGYDNAGITAERLAVIRGAIVSINNTIAASELVSDSRYQFKSPEGRVSVGGAFMAGMSADGIHVADGGTGPLADMQAEALAVWYAPKIDGSRVGDFDTDWCNPSGGSPANLTVNQMGGTNGLTLSMVDNILNASFSSVPGGGIRISVSSIAPKMAGLESGDKFIATMKIGIKRDGAATKVGAAFDLRLYSSDNAGFNYAASSQSVSEDGAILINTPVFSLDRDGSLLGTSSKFTVTLSMYDAGAFVAEIYQLDIRKID